MAENTINRKESEGQMNLYRLLRLENRENNFVFRDVQAGVQMRVNYQHFPLDTIAAPDLLKTLWKFTTSNYFKKIDEDELYRLNYIRNLLSETNSPILPRSIRDLYLPKHFHDHIATLFSTSYLQQLYDHFEDSIQGRIFFKELFVNWAQKQGKTVKKTKKIIKSHHSQSRRGKGNRAELKACEDQLDKLINTFQYSRDQEDDLQTERSKIEDEIARLEKLQQRNSQQNLDLVYQIQAKILEEEEDNQKIQSNLFSGRDAECLQWLIHNLEQKQIAESVAKIVSCQRKEGETKFQVHYETALNLQPQLLSERALKKLNHLRQTSLLKFYKTGVKSTRSYICHNFAGFAEMEAGLKTKTDKDYLQTMKKHGVPTLQTRQTMEEFEMCHHCKFLYQKQFLVECRFHSDRQTMPKISETQTDFANELTLQKGRVSQRFVAKHKNCMTGYARVGEEYICGRKFCISCLKDNYGQNWMKNNYGLCPFCQGICNCTRCLRNQKMNKLKAFFMTLGGDLSNLQANSLIDKLPVRKDELPKCKGKCRVVKTKKIEKDDNFRGSRKTMGYVIRTGKGGYETLEKRQVDSEELEKWSSVAEKQTQKSVRWRGRRRACSRLY